MIGLKPGGGGYHHQGFTATCPNCRMPRCEQQAGTATTLLGRLLRKKDRLVSFFASQWMDLRGLYWGRVPRSATPLRDPNSQWFIPFELWERDSYPPFVTGNTYVLSVDVVDSFLLTWRKEQALKIPILPLEDVQLPGERRVAHRWACTRRVKSGVRRRPGMLLLMKHWARFVRLLTAVGVRGVGAHAFFEQRLDGLKRFGEEVIAKRG